MSVIVFDVNETLLDLGGLDSLFADEFGDAALRPQWFATMVQLSFVGGLTGQYVDFSTAARAALQMTAERAGRGIAAGAVETVVAGMRRLPPHPDVMPALTRLRDAGLRLIALTNSVLEVAEAQLSYAGLADLFEGVYSADEVRALKPFAAPYLMVADQCGVDIGELCLVAAHSWDVSGALAAGAQAAFVGRGGAVPSPLGAQPAVIGADLEIVADALLAGRVNARSC
ncbi:haloacid dehalogenase type II [soil metagenome]